MSAAIKMIECSGTPQQMGEQYGEAAQAEIRENCDIFQSGWPSEESRRHAAVIRSRLQRSHPDILCELKGMASGAGVDLECLLLMNQVRHAPATVDTDACTPVILRDTPEGAIVAKNNDAPQHEKCIFILRKCQPRDGIAFIQLTYAGWLSGLDAMNAAGLANTHGSVGSKFAGLAQGPDIRLVVYQALKTCRNTEEFIAELRRFQCTGKGFSIAVGDATGHTAIIDAAVPLLGIRAENQNFAFSTNLYMTEGLQDADLRLPAKRHVAQYRYGYLSWIAAERPPRDQADIKALLSSHEPWAPCRHGGTLLSTTNWSMLALPAMRKVLVASGHPCSNPYIEYQL
jgi:isopenicillin-N N-acyltransferase-like protein